jgi:hypothetical protein
MNAELGRDLTRIAAQACNKPEFADSFSSYAEIIIGQNGSAPNDVYRRLADVRNDLIEGIEPYYDSFIEDTDPRSAVEYERRMRALTNVVEAWVSLHTPIS